MSAERAKLTKAQAKFLGDLNAMREDFRPGFDLDILTGPETAMARRLEARGLVYQPFRMGRGCYWCITDAGRETIAGDRS